MQCRDPPVRQLGRGWGGTAASLGCWSSTGRDTGQPPGAMVGRPSVPPLWGIPGCWGRGGRGWGGAAAPTGG